MASRTQRDGWTAEIRIPFKTLRFDKQEAQTFGVNFFRNIRRKNEQIYWSPVPRRFNIYRASLAGSLAELSGVKPGRNLRVKPSFVARINQGGSSKRESGGIDFDPQVSADVKYRLTHGLTLDLTYDPDFSQAEVDTEQINLTRFSLFFPEKRDFFLENEGFFHFGDIQGERGTNTQEEIRLFYSRRIGLSRSGQPIPLVGGARLSGRAGRFALGMLNIQQKESGASPAANFSVVRVRRDILANSDVGAIFVNRQSDSPGASHRAYGVDANFQFVENLTANMYVAKTNSASLPSDRNWARKFAVRWKDNFSDLQFLFADLQENFNPEVGFVMRTDFRHYRGAFHLYPRPKPNRLIRQFEIRTILRYSMDPQNRQLSRDDHYGFYIYLHDGSRVTIARNFYFERLDEPFGFRRDVIVPRGSYFDRDYFMSYSSNRSAFLATTLSLRTGTFWKGDKTTFNGSVFVINAPHLNTSFNYSYNRIRLPAADFDTHLGGLKIDYSFGPRAFLNIFVQYNSDARKWLTNLRFWLIHRPLSDIFFVFSDDNPLGSGKDTSRAFLVKYTHAFEF